MSIRLLILFIGIPALEIFTLIKTGQLIGLPATVLLVLATGVAGAYLARTQGLAVLAAIQNELAAGRLPSEHLLDGVLILAGGLLLLTPGLWTDCFGFCLLLPAGRRQLRKLVSAWLQKHLEQGDIRIYRR